MHMKRNCVNILLSQDTLPQVDIKMDKIIIVDNKNESLYGQAASVSPPYTVESQGV